MVMVVFVMVAACCKRGAGTDQQEQGGKDELLHGVKRSTISGLQNDSEGLGIKTTTPCAMPFGDFPERAYTK